jgi:hypothetical protein
MDVAKKFATFIVAKKDQIKSVAKKFAAFIVAKKDRIKTIATGYGLYSFASWFYDNPLYIAVIAIYGAVVGGIIMTLGSFVISYGLILWYNYRKVDWLGVDAVDSFRELLLHYAKKLAEWRADKIFGKILFVLFFLPIRILLVVGHLANHKKWGDAVAFVLLSIFEDPFVTTAYLRHGNYGQMKQHDWMIFIGSTILCNGYWILRTVVVIEVFKAVWESF